MKSIGLEVSKYRKETIMTIDELLNTVENLKLSDACNACEFYKKEACTNEHKCFWRQLEDTLNDVKKDKKRIESLKAELEERQEFIKILVEKPFMIHIDYSNEYKTWFDAYYAIPMFRDKGVPCSEHEFEVIKRGMQKWKNISSIRPVI